MGERHALLIGVSAYDDPGLAQLEASEADVAALEAVLKDPEIGAFDRVRSLLDAPRDAVLNALHDLFENRSRDDLALLYFSGHGVVDANNRFFFAVQGTKLERLRTSAVHFRDVHELMDETAAGAQVVMLDCCHAGAFQQRPRSPTGQKALTDAVVGTAEEISGAGRWVLAATDSTSFAFEQEVLIAEGAKPRLGVFTAALVDGMKGGAGLDDAEQITVDDLFEFAEQRVRATLPTMRPQRWVAEGSAPLVVARKKPAARLPDGIEAALRSDDQLKALGAVSSLTDCLNGSDPHLAAEAERAFRQVLEEPGNLLYTVAKKVQEALPNDAPAQSTDPLPAEPMPSAPPPPVEHPPADLAPDSTERGEDETPPAVGQVQGAHGTWTLSALGHSRFRIKLILRLAGASVAVILLALGIWNAVGPEGLADFEIFQDKLADGSDCPFCPEMVVLPAGTFLMGSPPDEEWRDDAEGPQREVTVPRFAIGATEVTFDQWDACVAGGGCNGYLPDDEGWGRGNRPVISVSWKDAQAYVAWLSETTGQPYRLPSEAEWEYAARVGTTTPFWAGATISANQANFGSNVGRTTPVDEFLANPWGLHDTAGNVWEWVADCWHESYEGAPQDGSAWLEAESGDCSSRVLRGGSWTNIPRYLRSAFRFRVKPNNRLVSWGFRVARTLTP